MNVGRTGTAIASVFVSILLGGCANLQTVWRNQEAAERLVSVDATQRVIVSNRVKLAEGEDQGKSLVRYCPEPSPDAIAAFASTLGLHLTGPAKGSTAELAIQNALSSQVASIAVRTPTTQALRDLITAACLGQMNGGFTGNGFAEAFERNQNFILAAHAISAIAGEAVAKQIALTATAQTGAAGDPMAASLDYQKKVAFRQAAETAYADAVAAKAKANTDLETANGELATAKAAKPLVQATITAAQEKVKTATGELAKATAEETKMKAAVADAKQLEKVALQAVTAVSFGQTTASGTVRPFAPYTPERNAPNDASVRAISDIVTTTLLRGFSLERCIKHLKEIAQIKIDGADIAKLQKNVLELCSITSNAEVEVQKERKERAIRSLQMQ